MTIRLFWLIRLAAFALIGILALIGPPHSTVQRAVQIVLFAAVGTALLACLVFEGSRRYRAWGLPIALAVMAAGGALAALTSGSGQSLVAFAGVAAVSAGTDLALPAALAIAAIGIVPIWIAGPIVGSSLGTLGGYPLLVVACLLLGWTRRSYRVQAEQAAALLEQYERVRAEQRRADVLDERARIAREIHDVLAHSLGALGIQIQAAKAMLTDQRDVDRAVAALGTAQRMAADGLTETRRAVHALRMDSLPLGEEIAGVVDTHRQRYQVPVTFETSGQARALPPDASLALLRAAQEALVNAAKHASGQPVEVRLDYGDAGVRLSVVNPLGAAAEGPGQFSAAAEGPGQFSAAAEGPGQFSAAAGGPGQSSTGGYGLKGMRERLLLLNGTLLAGPRDDNEWAVTAELPAP